jgi:uncharacterized protein YprB with RNaseH-like and TPR domain
MGEGRWNREQMTNLLKKQLAQIRKRALQLRRKGEAREESAGQAGRTIVDEIVKTGAVVSGADFDKLSTLRRRWPHRGAQREALEDPRDVLERFKDGEPAPLEALVPGEARAIGTDEFYLVRPVGEAVDPEALGEATVFSRLKSWPDDVLVSRFGRRGKRSSATDTERTLHPERVLFLDIETGGLSANTYLFLCGMMFLEKGNFVVEQPFARNYAEETGLLRHVHETIARFDTVVTYNGASFDLPFVRTRMAIHRIPDLTPFGSVDLLHTARRVFRGILPNRKLATVERHLRGFERTNDIPGRYIPDAWHDYVRSGDGRVMRNVLCHNRMDLFTMAVLVNHLASGTAATR